ncbi:MAG TPA: fatty acid cis/trans isomerase [Cellvibrio sp.]|nr:fatty acid cis/trans isomerase [Cellvibrio sp.]
MAFIPAPFRRLTRLSTYMTRSSLGILLLVMIGCATIGGSYWDQQYGIAKPRELPTTPTKASLTYYKDTKPIIEQRCVVCHGCYDSPCQLKLESYEGLLRGANPELIYAAARLTGAAPTRLFEDASSTAEWRGKGFHPVLNERSNTAEANIKAGVMAQMLELKKANPLPSTAILPASLDLSFNYQQYCSTIETFEDFAKENPLWGMPYGLPGLSEKEHRITMDWLKQGAAMGTPKALSAGVQQQIHSWEAFLNGDSLKQQLVSRYIYEHLFLAQLFFPEAPDFHFRLVRSSTPPGQPLNRITTERPYDNPNVNRVYYRIWQDPSSQIAKTYMPYALDKKRMNTWQQLFFSTDPAFAYEVTQLPSYDHLVAANPFVAFAELPVNARYRFMINEAHFTIMNFIKGPVCRGQVALNVIQDHFWVFFFSPETQATEGMAKFLADNSKHLELPSEAGNTLRPLSNWHKYSELQTEYLSAKANFINQAAAADNGIEMDDIWNGDKGTNPNAALTIFRHGDSASVHKGLIGQPPQTAWVIGYPLLERIHYLLVAGFDVYGNSSHQLLSRLYMDFLRIEGEMNFVGLLPKEAQQKTMEHWYRNAETDVDTYIDLFIAQLKARNNIQYHSDNPQQELYRKLKQHLGNAALSPINIRTQKLPPGKLAQYEKLQNTRGKPISFLPPTTVIHIPNVGLFTLVHNSAYSNLAALFGEEKRRLPDEDNLTIARGMIGAYPNSFMRVEEQQIDDFINRLQHLDSEEDYRALRDIYGVRRTSADFWAFSDKVHQLYKISQPDEAALLDYNRLENR